MAKNLFESLGNMFLGTKIDFPFSFGENLLGLEALAVLGFTGLGWAPSHEHWFLPSST